MVEGDRACRSRSTTGSTSVRAIAAGGSAALDRVAAWATAQPPTPGARSPTSTLGPAVPDPGAIYTVGLNYRAPRRARRRPARSGRSSTARLPTSRRRPTARSLAWDRALTAERRRGVRARRRHRSRRPSAADHVFGYTIVNDVSSRDPWLDGDQWLLGKSMPGFCPVGPWVVTRRRARPRRPPPRLHDQRRADPGRPDVDDALRDRRDPRRSSAATSTLRPGDLIATGTPARLADAAGPGAPPRARRRRDLLDRGHRRADHPPSPDRHEEETAMKPPTVFLGEMTEPRGRGVPRASHDTVIVPTGSTEQHGPHGPLLTDVLVPTEVARRVAPRIGAARRPDDQLRAVVPARRASPASSTSGSRRSWR